MLPYSKEAPGRYREYGFVHFKERAGALAAAARCDEAAPTLDGKALAVRRQRGGAALGRGVTERGSAVLRADAGAEGRAARPWTGTRVLLTRAADVCISLCSCDRCCCCWPVRRSRWPSRSTTTTRGRAATAAAPAAGAVRARTALLRRAALRLSVQAADARCCCPPACCCCLQGTFSGHEVSIGVQRRRPCACLLLHRGCVSLALLCLLACLPVHVPPADYGGRGRGGYGGRCVALLGFAAQQLAPAATTPCCRHD